jgi:CCR4-NOT transcription complex subunit 7/8
MTISGLVLNDEIRWISFHSKYDFGYLLKTLTCTELPMDESGFVELLQMYFPSIYDVKVSKSSSFCCCSFLTCVSPFAHST